MRKNPETLIQKDTCIWMLIAALSPIAKIWKRPKDTSTDECQSRQAFKCWVDMSNCVAEDLICFLQTHDACVSAVHSCFFFALASPDCSSPPPPTPSSVQPRWTVSHSLMWGKKRYQLFYLKNVYQLSMLFWAQAGLAWILIFLLFVSSRPVFLKM